MKVRVPLSLDGLSEDDVRAIKECIARAGLRESKIMEAFAELRAGQSGVLPIEFECPDEQARRALVECWRRTSDENMPRGRNEAVHALRLLANQTEEDCAEPKPKPSGSARFGVG